MQLSIAADGVCLRLDTWDGSRKMRDYYGRQGFVRDQYFHPDRPLPADYR